MAEIASLIADDYGALSAFLSTFQGETRGRKFWLDRFHLWWDKNPAFENCERGWTIRDDHTIVGFLGCIPSYFQLLGRETTVFSVTTWRVLPEFRSRSIDLLFKAIASGGSSLLFDTTPNQQASEIVKALKFQPLPRNENRKSILILDYRRAIRARLGIPLPTAAVQVLSLGLNILQFLRLRRGLGMHGELHVKQLSSADSCFDQLWQRTRHLYPNTNIRTADAVDWYCFGPGSHAKTVLGCFQNNRLLGYVVYVEKTGGGRRLLECVDLWVDPSHSGVVASLLDATRTYGEQKAFEFIEFPHFTSSVAACYKKLGLFQLVYDPRREYFKARVDLNGQIDETNSYFVGAQGDYGL